jgi:predicted acylesterase/phospholipase RssA
VTRIAGTSAGAIVGCIFAGRIAANTVRTILKIQFGKELTQLFPKPSRVSVLKLLFTGRPLWKEKGLGKFLASLFGEKHLYYLDELSIPTLVVAANLNTNQKTVHNGHFEIVQALLDSSGIPFCFRTWRHAGGSVIVDGGLCENLPLEELVSEEKKYGRVAAISFDPVWSGSPSNIKDFSVALLDTAINNSIERAKQRLGREATFSTNPRVGTFDFTEALRKLDDAYDLVKYQDKDFFKKFVSKPQRLVGDPWSVENLQFMKKLGQIYNAQHRTPVRYDYCRLLVQANSLLEPPTPDDVHYIVKLRTSDSPLYCYRVALSESTSNPTTAEEAEWEVFGPDGKPIKTIHLPMVDQDTKTSCGAILVERGKTQAAGLRGHKPHAQATG